MAEHPIVVVGAGLGGLSAALHLAAAGYPVVVCEKNARAGGKLSVVAEQGYTFDVGPSLLTMPWVLRDTLAVAGVDLDDVLDIMPLDPLCRYFWPDGTHFETRAQLAALLAEIERLEPRDVAGFLRFFSYTAGIYEAALEPFLCKAPASLREMLSPSLARHSLALDPLRSVDQAVRSYFRSPYLRQLFNRYATYNGSSPYRAPATFNIIPYVEFAQGGWYVRGGMYGIVEALAQASRRLGVQIRTSTPVVAVESERGSVRSVRLADGEVLPASAVIVNADPQVAYRTLLGHERMAQRLERLELSCSGFVLLLGVDCHYADLAQHTIFFSADYQAEFAAIFDHGVPAADPTVYVNLTSPRDPHHAPPGHSNLFVLVNAPAHRGAGSRVNWHREAASYGDLVIRKLERMGLADLQQHIRYRRALTPIDLEGRYQAPGGAIYGLASNSPWSAFRRPPLRSPVYRGLYFVGGGTHPGGGIPLVLLSGRSVASLVGGDTCVATCKTRLTRIAD